MGIINSILTNSKAEDLVVFLTSSGLVYKTEQVSSRNLWIYFDDEQSENYKHLENNERAKSISKELGCSTMWFTNLDGIWDHYLYCKGELKERIDSYPGIYDWCGDRSDGFTEDISLEFETRRMNIEIDVTTGSAVRISQHFDLVNGDIIDLDIIMQNALHILGPGNDYGVDELVEILGYNDRIMNI